MNDPKRYEEDQYNLLKDKETSYLNWMYVRQSMNTNGKGQLCEAAIIICGVVDRIRKERDEAK
jgi:hypothetical protein